MRFLSLAILVALALLVMVALSPMAAGQTP
jgi:hypothetical protein